MPLHFTNLHAACWRNIGIHSFDQQEHEIEQGVPSQCAPRESRSLWLQGLQACGRRSQIGKSDQIGM